MSDELRFAALPVLLFMNVAFAYMLWVVISRVSFLESSDRKLWQSELMRRSREQQAKRHKGDGMRHQCCYIWEKDHSPCHKAAQFIVYYSSEDPHNYTHSCTDHVHLMIDAYSPSYVYPMETDQLG